MNKPVSIALSLAALLIFAAPSFCKDEVPAPVVKSITASSDYNNNRVEKAADGKPLTRWESEWEDNQWVQVELEAPAMLYGIGIKWETAAAFRYAVMGSNDGNLWVTLAMVEDGIEGEDMKINFQKPAEYKYVKVDCYDRATAWGFSIWEIELKTDGPYRKLAKRQSMVKGKTFFSVERKDGKYWFSDTSGKPFISKGVNVVLSNDGAVLQNSQYYDVSKNYKDNRDWAKNAVKRLRKWKFNTVGCWSDAATFYYDMPFTVILNVSSTTDHRLVDVFDPMFAENADATAASKCRRFRDARYLLGYFIDNELPWYGDVGWHTGHAPLLLDEYARLPENAPGYAKLAEFLKDKYGLTVEEYMKVRGAQAKEGRELFAGVVAEEYFSVITSCIRKYDPNHLVLGVRFAGSAPEGVIAACGKYCDVVSLNYYCKNMKVDRQHIDNFYFIGQKPMMITEFSYRAMENRSGVKNNKGADVTVKTQADRAEGYDKYITQMMEFPYMIGYHWFQYFDQSPQGRSFDGENSNYGIVDIYDKEYELLTAAMKKLNSKADTIHKKTALPYPEKAVITSGYAPVNNKGERKEAGQFCDVAVLDLRKLGVWADGSSSAKIKFTKEKAEGGEAEFLRCAVDTGSGWGCGFSVTCDAKMKNADGSFDLQGYKGIKIKLSATEGLPFSVFINESGADEMGKPEYKGVRGADGESFTSEPNSGAGKIEVLEYPFDQFMLRSVYGNQSGNRTLDLQAVRNIDLYFPGNSGDGTCDIYEVTLY
ncbi:MAG: discoidin domain-containing protein [Candidatus Omnitrophica bacterium]|nr:discoidin domain-containing protein [Candidatus Omnitrophota bacterium]